MAATADGIELVASLGRGALLPVYLLTGAEKSLVDRGVALLRERGLTEPRNGQAAITGMDAFNVESMSALDLKSGGQAASRILTAAKTLPMMGPRRVVIVRDLDLLNAEELEPLVSYFEAPSDSTLLILTATKLDERTRFAQGAKRHTHVVKLEAPPAQRLGRFVQGEAESRGVRLTSEASARLTELVGNDLGRLGMALEQLALYTATDATTRAASIGAEVVDELIAETRERTSWELADALVAGQTDKALRALRSLLSRKESPIQIFGAVCYRFRQVWIATSMVQRGATSAELAKAARVPPFAASKLMEEGKRFARHGSEARFRSIWQRIWEADRSLKRSSVSGEMVLEALILQLAPPAAA